MKDVAQHAGVSIRAVSRAINNLDGVAPETREKILAVAGEMGFRPSQLARALVTRHSHTLGLAIPHLANPYFAEVAQGVFDTARERGYSVLLNNINWSSIPSVEGWYTLADHAVEGMITDVLYGHEMDLIHFSRRFKPIVTLMKPVPYAGISSVVVDMLSGAERIMRYLIEKGHRRIGMVAPEVDCQDKMERIVAYRRIMHQAGLESHVQLITHWKNPDIASGREAALQLLGEHPDLSAIYSYNDLVAMGSIQACRELGRRVPDDCAVTGFDDIPYAAIIEPPLTTIHYDKFEIGRRAVLRLLEMIEQPERAFDTIQLEATLVVRKSA